MYQLFPPETEAFCLDSLTFTTDLLKWCFDEVTLQFRKVETIKGNLKTFNEVDTICYHKYSHLIKL
jgi:hypothetical protein